MRSILLIRGINVGQANRLAMARLREVLSQAGYKGARTYLQSGNVVVDAEHRADELAQIVRDLIAEHFGLAVAVIGRSADEIAAIIAANPLAAIADDPKLQQVGFCSQQPGAEALARLQALVQGQERVLLCGREIHTWHPDGIGRSRLAGELASKRLGVEVTARNWRTVQALAQMVAE